MRKHGIKADVRQKKRNRKQEQQQYQEDNLLERKFIQVAPNLIWVSDTTELTYGRNNKVRLHVVLDLYGRYVLSYHISRQLRQQKPQWKSLNALLNRLEPSHQ